MANILIVDDDKAILDLIHNILNKSGHFIKKIDKPEKIIQDNFEELKETEKVTEDLLTPMSSFGVYSDSGEYLYGNFSDKDKNKILNKYNISEKSSGLKSYITSIKREEGTLLIKYPLTMQYKTEKMRSILPNPEIAAIILFIFELIIGIVLISNRFAKKVNKELRTLLIAAEKIEDGNLDFNVAKSSIKEMNILLQGIQKMKESLKNQGESLCRTKNIDMMWKIDIEKNLYVKGYRDELERALMNIISNAVNLSSQDSTIKIINTMDKNQLIIQIIDQGKGFSKKMLKHGKEQFAMDDESRSKNEKHGLGLYIADNIIKKYNGEIILSNNVDSGGVVMVKIPT